MRILIKFPTRGRKDLFFSTLSKFYTMASDIEKIQFQITIDSDDVEMNNPEVLKKLESHKNLSFSLGKSTSKIDAVNRDIDTSECDIILLASDDMVPIFFGYDEIIRNSMKEEYPDTDGVLWFFDGHRTDLNTLCILGKKYYDRFAYIYHPTYLSTFCDNEFMDVANLLGKQKKYDRVIIEHQHPAWGYGKNDNIHLLNDINDQSDKENYSSRKNNLFDLDIKNILRKPRIKICHLLLDPNQPQDISLERWNSVIEKQKASITAFEKISSHFACYSQMYSIVNRTDLPSENCAQPEIINTSKEFINVPPVLSYGHYGAYVAHRSAIEDFGNYDAILVIESDVVYDVSPEEMIKEIYDAYEFGVQRSGAMFTFGAVSYGTASRASVSDTAIYMGKYKQIDHFLCAHCYMVFGSEKESMQNKLKNSGWHAWDIWLYWNYDTRVPIFATSAPLVHEPIGYSVIDYVEKKL